MTSEPKRKAGAKRGFLQLMGANIATKVFGLVAIGIFTRNLEQAELAFLPVYDMVASMVHVFFGFGLQPTIIRRLPSLLVENRPAGARLIRNSVQLLAVGSMLFAACVVALAEPLASKLLGSRDAAGLLQLTGLGACLFGWRNTMQYLLWADSRYDRLSSVRTAVAVGRTVLGLAGLAVDGIRGVAIGFVVNDILTTVLAYMFCLDLLRLTPGEGMSKRQLIRESVPFYFESYLTYLRNQGDNWIVASLLGPAAMGVYYVAKRFPMMLMMFVESLDKVVTTTLSQRRKQVDSLTRALDELMTNLVTVSIPAIFLLMGVLPLMIRLVAGPGFEGAVVPGIILCLVQLSRILAVPYSRAVFILREPSARVRVTVYESIVLIIALFGLVPLWAEPGVTLARLLAAVTTLGGSCLMLAKVMEPRMPWRRMVISLAISVLTGLSAYWVTSAGESVLRLLAGGATGAVMFLIASRFLQPRELRQGVESLLPRALAAPFRRMLGG